MSDVDRGVEMNASSGSFTSPEEANSPCNVWPSLERSINQAATTTDLITIFGEMLQLLNTGGVKKALTGKKQLLLSLVAPKYRRVNEEDGKSIWTKEVAQIFGKVLDSISNAKMRGE